MGRKLVAGILLAVMVLVVLPAPAHGLVIFYTTNPEFEDGLVGFTQAGSGSAVAWVASEDEFDNPVAVVNPTNIIYGGKELQQFSVGTHGLDTFGYGFKVRRTESGGTKSGTLLTYIYLRDHLGTVHTELRLQSNWTWQAYYPDTTNDFTWTVSEPDEYGWYTVTCVVDLVEPAAGNWGFGVKPSNSSGYWHELQNAFMSTDGTLGTSGPTLDETHGAFRLARPSVDDNYTYATKQAVIVNMRIDSVSSSLAGAEAVDKNWMVTVNGKLILDHVNMWTATDANGDTWRLVSVGASSFTWYGQNVIEVRYKGTDGVYYTRGQPFYLTELGGVYDPDVPGGTPVEPDPDDGFWEPPEPIQPEDDVWTRIKKTLSLLLYWVSTPVRLVAQMFDTVTDSLGEAWATVSSSVSKFSTLVAGFWLVFPAEVRVLMLAGISFTLVLGVVRRG